MKALTLTLILFLPIILFTQTAIEKYEGNPVLDVGPAGSWDETAVITPSVVVNGTTFKMWYTGYDGSHHRIGYATSTDGINWTKADDVNPVLDLGVADSWDDESVASPCVLYDGNIYKMWYGGNGLIGYATSPDGITWTKHDGPVLEIGSEGSWDDYLTIIPKVVFLENRHMMFFSGYDGEHGFSIGCARSPDGIVWTKEEDFNPILEASYSWEDNQLYTGDVLMVNNMFEMWYAAGSGGYNLRTGYATSSDGLNWSKNDVYVLTYGAYGEWDYKFACLSSSYFDGETYHFWYDSEKYKTSGAIGYATSTIVGVKEEVSIPVKYELNQNYPNPFNPSTIIKYNIPNESNITLKVFDVLGREVATLVNQQQKAGYYEVQFTSNNVQLTSGVYFYKILAGDFVETKKMLLLR